MSRFTIAGSVIALLAPIAPLHAQFGANAPGDFMFERILKLSAAVAPVPPVFPDAVLAALQSGALEIHQRLIYNSAQHTLEQLAFVLPAGAAVPFADPSAAPVADHYLIQVESASIASSPRPSVILAGHVILNDVPTPFGDITGAGVTLTFGYTAAGNSVQFGPILESVSPMYGLYTDTGVGSLSLTPSASFCSAATLNGSYMFQLGGSVQSSGAWAPFQESGSFQADGKGNITVLDSGNLAGSVFVGRTFPIAYTLEHDCSGTFKFGANTMDIRVSHDGKAINMVFTNPATVAATGTGRLQ